MKQCGIALLLVLCVLLLMSGILMTSYYRQSEIFLLSKINKQKKLEKWLLLGAEEKIVIGRVKDNLINILSSHISSEGYNSPENIKIDDLNVSYNLIDNTNCFNIKFIQPSLSDAKQSETYSWTVFKNIVNSLDVSDSDKNNITKAVRYYLKENLDKEFVIGKVGVSRLSMISMRPIASEIDFLVNINSDIYSELASILCVRYDNSLVININTLEIKHGKLIQAILMNLVDENAIVKTILSKPNHGWINLHIFLDTLIKNSDLTKEDIYKVREIIMSTFSHDRYFISLLLWPNNEHANYQLTSFLHVRLRGVEVLHRRFGISEKHNK